MLQNFGVGVLSSLNCNGNEIEVTTEPVPPVVSIFNVKVNVVDIHERGKRVRKEVRQFTALDIVVIPKLLGGFRKDLILRH